MLEEKKAVLLPFRGKTLMIIRSSFCSGKESMWEIIFAKIRIKDSGGENVLRNRYSCNKISGFGRNGCQRTKFCVGTVLPSRGKMEMRKKENREKA